MSTITAHIVCRGAGAAADWYVHALGAEELSRVLLPGGEVMTIELRFGDSTIALADEFPHAGVLGPLSIGGTPVVLHLMSEDVDALWKQAIEAGATELHPLEDQFWGERYGQITDPFGHRWGLAQKIRDVSPEEIARGAAEAFG